MPLNKKPGPLASVDVFLSCLASAKPSPDTFEDEGELAKAFIPDNQDSDLEPVLCDAVRYLEGETII